MDVGVTTGTIRHFNMVFTLVCIVSHRRDVLDRQKLKSKHQKQIAFVVKNALCEILNFT